MGYPNASLGLLPARGIALPSPIRTPVLTFRAPLPVLGPKPVAPAPAPAPITYRAPTPTPTPAPAPAPVARPVLPAPTPVAVLPAPAPVPAPAPAPSVPKLVARMLPTLQAKVAATQAALPNATVAAPVPTASVVADGGNGVTVPRKALWSRMAASRTAAAPAPAPYVAPYAAPYTAPQGLPPTASVVAPETAPEMAADTTAAKKPSSKNSLVMLAAGALALLVVTRKGGTFTSWR